MKKYWVQIGLVVIILASFALMVFSARGDSLTVDEKIHISAGYLHVWKGDYTFNAEHPPLLNDLEGLFAKIAKPNLPTRDLSTFQGSDQWEFGDLFFYHSGNNVEKIIFWARLPIILLTLGLIYLVFCWAKSLFGPKAGLLAAALVGFSPNILAHGRLATTDMGVAFFFVLTIWLLRKYILKPNWKNALLLGLSIGLVISSKFSGLLVLPIVFGGLIFLSKKLSHFLIILIVPIVLFWGIYAISMRSELVSLPPVYTLSESLGSRTLSHAWSKFLIVPFDKFARGYEILAEHNSVGHWSYLNGQVFYEGRWYYFPLVLWYKLTEPTLLLLGLSIFAFVKIRKGFLQEFLVIFPPLLFLGISLTSKIDIGIRHILPVLPFMYIFISRLALSRNLVLKPLVAILIIFHIGIGIFAFPNYIAYFNQIAGGSKGGIKHLVDSNLDWNQNIKRFAQYAQENNINQISEYCWDLESFQYYGISAEILPTTPVSDKVVVVCGHQLIFGPAWGYDISWVKKYEPDAIIGEGIYVWRFDTSTGSVSTLSEVERVDKK